MADFADDMVEELLDRTGKGEPLTVICRDSRMPARSSVYAWIESDQEFAGRFRAARARGVHSLAEECLAIADDAPASSEGIQKARLRIDTRLRLAGKWSPKEYGDKLDVNYNSEVTHRHDLSGMSTDELDALESLVAKAADRAGDTGGASAAEPRRVH